MGTGNVIFACLRARRRTCAVASTLLILLSALPSQVGADEVYGTYVGRALGRRVAYERDDEQRRSWAGTLGFELDSGESFRVFCIQLEVAVRTGDRYRSDGPVESLHNGCQIRYILDNYPGSTADTEDEAAARQLAVWRFSDDLDLATVADEDQAVRDRAVAIAAEAASGACPQRRTEPPELRLEPEATVAEVGRRVAYTVTAGALDAGSTAHVVVTGPAVLDDGTQTADLELDAAGAAVFGVTGTGAGDSEVHVDLPYHLGAGTVFSHIDEERPTQRLVLAEHADVVARAAATVRWSESPTATPTETAPAPTATPVDSTPVPTSTPLEQTAVPTPTLAWTPTPASSSTHVASTGTPASSNRTRTPVPSTPSIGTTPVLPERLPGTGGGGADGAPSAAVRWLVVSACLAALAARRRVRDVLRRVTGLVGT